MHVNGNLSFVRMYPVVAVGLKKKEPRRLKKVKKEEKKETSDHTKPVWQVYIVVLII